jgi:hypothetical protein
MQKPVLGEALPQKALSSQVRRCKPLLWLFFNGFSGNCSRELLERNSFSSVVTDRESVRNAARRKKKNSLIRPLEEQYFTQYAA